MITLKKDCSIVSDVHFSQENKTFLQEIEKNKSSQIILNGDMFEFVSKHIDASVKYNQELIDKINTISQTKDIIYLEGNHDFVLKDLFKNVKIISLENQPICCKYNDKIIYISHGDCFVKDVVYNLYTKYIRKKLILKIMNVVNKILNNKIFKIIISSQLKKDKCRTISNFKQIAKNRASLYPKNAQIIIEGHYHQGVNFLFKNIKYINLSAFYCDNKIHKISDLIKNDFK